MHILVTGGCGFIGSHVALHLRAKGNKVSVMDNLVRRGAEQNIANLERNGVSFFHGDVRNPEDLANLPAGIELICDTSAQPSVVSGYANPLFDITNNGLGAIHILEYARARRVPLIFWSSNRVYGADRLNNLPRHESSTRYDYDAAAWNRLKPEQRPAGFDPGHGISEEFSVDGGQRSIYGLSKLIADAACQEYAHAFDLPVVVNRFGVISGIGQFAKSTKAGSSGGPSRTGSDFPSLIWDGRENKFATSFLSRICSLYSIFRSDKFPNIAVKYSMLAAAVPIPFH